MMQTILEYESADSQRSHPEIFVPRQYGESLSPGKSWFISFATLDDAHVKATIFTTGSIIYRSRVQYVEHYESKQGGWLKQVEKLPSTLSFKQMTALTRDLSFDLSCGKFEQVDQNLKSVAVSQLGVEAAITIARTTFTARNKLPSWRAFVKNIKDRFLAEGVDPRSFRGLD